MKIAECFIAKDFDNCLSSQSAGFTYIALN